MEGGGEGGGERDCQPLLGDRCPGRERGLKSVSHGNNGWKTKREDKKKSERARNRRGEKNGDDDIMSYCVSIDHRHKTTRDMSERVSEYE